jgi:hypothetical protein
MNASVRLRGIAALGGVAAISALGALAPETFATGTVHHCNNLVVPITQEVEPGVKRAFNVHAKTISTKGVSCAAAHKFIGLVYNNTTGKTPEHYKCVTGHFKVAVGFVPTVCTHGSSRIQYGAQGG